jgi:hypothetical protein
VKLLIFRFLQNEKKLRKSKKSEKRLIVAHEAESADMKETEKFEELGLFYLLFDSNKKKT